MLARAAGRLLRLTASAPPAAPTAAALPRLMCDVPFLGGGHGPPVSSFKGSLLDVVERELSDEFSEPIEVPELDELLARVEANGFSLVDERGSTEVQLVRRTAVESTRIRFDIEDREEESLRDQLDEDVLAELQARGDDVDPEDMLPESVPFVPFVATVARPGRGHLVFSCVATDGLEVQRVGMVPGSGDDDDDEPEWLGPVFEELDPDLQAKLWEFLEERGIDNELAVFVNMFTDMKEQNEYVEWLEGVRAFCSGSS